MLQIVTDGFQGRLCKIFWHDSNPMSQYLQSDSTSPVNQIPCYAFAEDPQKFGHRQLFHLQFNDTVIILQKLRGKKRVQVLTKFGIGWVSMDYLRGITT